jgi:glycosyltransferase involved in cell wall biosynthesis
MQPSQGGANSVSADLARNSMSTIVPEVSVIIPTRNEDACLGACLESLVRQDGPAFEIIVVDDASSDRTREIAESFPGVRVIEAGPLPPGSSGKSNAAMAGARVARGTWLLFTDADTVHLPGSLARALAEMKEDGAALLSYSPQQELHGIAQRAVMPVIFAELASAYKPKDVCDPNCAAAAANGQYLLISREAYDAIGGHAKIAHTLLEDVELARAVKSRGGRLRFRYGGDEVRTRMYRSFAQLREGWTKNLVLLFPSPTLLAILRLLEFSAVVGGVTVALASKSTGRTVAFVAGAVAVGVYTKVLWRVQKAHAGAVSTALSLFGLPLFSYLLLRSRLYYKWNRVTWKGRRYAMPQTHDGASAASAQSACPATGE